MEYITAGESHGPVLTAIVSGVPAGLAISEKAINSDLAAAAGRQLKRIRCRLPLVFVLVTPLGRR